MMKRRASFAVFALTVGTLIVVGALLYLLHGRQVLATVKALSEAAAASEKLGDHQKATEKYQLALGLKKDDPRLLVDRARSYAKAAESPETRERAVAFLIKALGVAPDEERSGLSTQLGDQYLRLGKFTQATQEADRLINTYKAVQEGNRILALSLVGNYEVGAIAANQLGDVHILKTLRDANKSDPTDDQLITALAKVYRQWPEIVEVDDAGKSEAERVKLADKLINDFVSPDAPTAKALLVRAVYRWQFDIPGAKEDARKAIDLDGTNRATLRTAYFVLLPKGNATKPQDYEEAVDLGERLLSFDSSHDPAINLSLGRAYLAAGNSTKAIETWNAGILATKQPPLQFAFLSSIADAQIKAESAKDLKATLEQTDKVLDQLHSTPSISGEQLRQYRREHNLRQYVLIMLEGDSKLAISQLKSLLEEKDTDVDNALRALYPLVQLYAKSGEYGEAATAFEKVASNHPTMEKIANLHASAGQAWLAAGESANARVSFYQALKVVDTDEARLEHAWTLLDLLSRAPNAQFNAKQFSDQMGLINQTLLGLEKAKDGAIATTDQWRIPAMRVRWKYLQASRQKSPTNDNALSDLQAVERIGEQSPEAISFLCIEYQRRDRPEEADRVLKKLENVDSDEATRYRTELRLAAMRKDLPLILDVFAKTGKVLTVEERSQWAAELSNYLRQASDLPGLTGINTARSIVATEVERNPDAVLLWKLLVEIDVDRRDAAGIAKTVETLTKTPLTDKSALCYARIFQALTNPKVTRKELDDALNDQKLFATLRPYSFETETLLGLIEHKLGDYAQQHGLSSEQRTHHEGAVRAYDAAIKLGEPRLFVFEKVNELVLKVGPIMDESYYLPKDNFVLASSPKLTEVFAASKLKSGEAEAAIEQAKQAIELRPKDASAHILYAQLLGAESRLIEAEQEFDRALTLDATSIKVWLEYFAFRMRYRRSEAGKLLERLEAATRVPATQKVEALARCYELLGNQEKANEYYLQALKNSPKSLELSLSYCKFLARFDAKASIERLRAMLAESPLETAILRTLAGVLFTHDEAGAEEAQVLLLAGDLPDDNRAENRRTLIRLLSTRKDDKSLLKAIDVAKEVFAAYPHEVGDQLALAAAWESYAKQAIDPGTRAQRIAQAKEVWKKDISTENQYPSAKQRYAEKRAMDLARFAVRQGETDAATRLEEAEKALNNGRRDDPGVISEFMTLNASIRRMDHWETWANRLDEIDTNKVRSTGLRAKFLVLEGKDREAKELITPFLIAALGASKDQQRLKRIEMAGQIYTDLGMHEEAVAWFKDLVKADPSRYQLLAISLAKTGRVTEAIEFCKEIYGSKKDVAVLYAMTDLVSTYGKSAEAIKTISALVREARKAEPRNPKLLESAAVLEFLTANHEESERLLREALAIAPNDVSILNNLACILADKGIKLDEAVTFVDKAIAIQSGEAPLLDTKGIVLLARKQVDEALPLLELATSPPNKDPRHHLHLAFAYLKEKKYEECKKQLAKAKELGIDTLTLTPLDARYLEQVKSGKTNDS